MHLSILLALHAAATQLFSGLSLGGSLVDSGFWVLDCVSGTLLLALIALLSIGGLLEKLQTILLFNSNFARSAATPCQLLPHVRILLNETVWPACTFCKCRQYMSPASY
jgi:hypothetical protein